MAINIDPILTAVNSLCAADKADFSNVIFSNYVKGENFAQHHELMTEVRNNEVIPYIDSKPDYGFLKVSQSGCASNICDVNATASVKRWNPVDYDCRLVICKKDLTCDFRKFWDMNCKDYKNMNDAFMQFIVGKVNENFNASQWRIGYFDDNANTDEDYAGIDGLFKQWLALAPVGAPNRFEIPENDEATIAEQMQLAPDRAYTIFRDMFRWASTNNTALLASQGLHFDVTPELAWNYLFYLQENKEVQCCFSSTDGITGSKYSMDQLNYMGVPIFIRHEWQQIVQWQQQQAGSVNLPDPHRAVLTTRGNKPAGTCDAAAFRDFDMWYNKDEKKIKIDIATSFDMKVLRNTDFAIAI